MLADILELMTHAMTPGAQEAAPPSGTAQPEVTSLPPHIPRVLVLKSEALAAHLASSAAAGAAATNPNPPSPQAPAQPVVTRILLVAFLALLIARRLRRP